jgi:hypothetical protein
MLVLSLLTLVTAISYGYIGEFSLPFSAAFCAALFLFDNKERRILSYLIPSISVVILFLLRGPYYLIGAEYIILAIILYVCYTSSISKAETSIYLTLTAAVFLIVSFYLSGAKQIGSFVIDDVIKYYSDSFSIIRTEFVKILSSYQYELKDGTTSTLMSAEEAFYYVDRYLSLFGVLIGAISFAIAGFMIKIFTSSALKICKNGILKSFSVFLPSSMVAYFYVILSLISIFIGFDSNFEIAIKTAAEILMLVFAYIGFRYFLMLAKPSERKTSLYFILVIGFLVMPGLAIEILSFIGAWFSISCNHINPN